MNNLSRKVFLILLVCVGLAFARVPVQSRTSMRPPPWQKDTLKTAITPVALTQAKTSAPTDTITFPGNIEGWYEAPIYARVEGYVKAWYEDYGHDVKKGDVLAEINTPDLDADYRQADCRSAIRTCQECAGSTDRQTLPGHAGEPSAL